MRTERSGRQGRVSRCSATAALFALLGLAGCAPRDPRPSVVLVVLDTVRASAVSAYGDVEGTTPVFDALAAEGLLYRNAIAPAPWTLPSHASLFTGLGVDVHRVGTPGRVSLDEGASTLAEILREAGYETAAFSENMLVSDAFHLLQGFDHKRVSAIIGEADGAEVDYFGEIDVQGELGVWLGTRDTSRPFFVFVNLIDAHDPYRIREENRWVRADVTRDRMSRYADEPELFLCDAIPRPEDVEILRGLYRGDVHASDEKLGRILAQLRRHGGGVRTLAIVTSDHGEMFGERDLLGHEFTVRPGALRVPLVVHGLDLPPAVVDAPVSLTDVLPSLLGWLGMQVPEGLDGHPLPTGPGADASRAIVSAYTDDWPQSNAELPSVEAFSDREKPRRRCGPDDKVRGGMVALTRWPWRFYWFERYEPELYDLRWDDGELSDVAPMQPEVVARLSAELEPFARRAGLWPDSARDVVSPPTPEALEALRALGYVD